MCDLNCTKKNIYFNFEAYVKSINDSYYAKLNYIDSYLFLVLVRRLKCFQSPSFESIYEIMDILSNIKNTPVSTLIAEKFLDITLFEHDRTERKAFLVVLADSIRLCDYRPTISNIGFIRNIYVDSGADNECSCNLKKEHEITKNMLHDAQNTCYYLMSKLHCDAVK